jgi:DMSO/TMAO reductase YedYZ molybdopterin-dependent catalytic subunit
MEDVAIGKPIGRRVFLGMLGFGAGGILWGSKVQRVISSALAPVTAADPTGLSSFIPAAGGFRFYSVIGYFPHRADADYRLKVTGLVDKPLDLSLADLKAMAPTGLTKDFQCVTGWRVADVDWTGVKLADVLAAAGLKPEAKALTFQSFDGTYTESLTLDQGRRDDVIVAYEMQGKPVSSAHGGPVRLYVAPMYGYKSCKWLSEIQVVDAVEAGYWENRGYDTDAFIGKSNGRDDAPVA